MTTTLQRLVHTLTSIQHNFAFVSILLVALVLAFAPFVARAGNDAGTQSALGDLNARCNTSADCRAELRCSFGTGTDATLRSDGLVHADTPGGGTCQPAYQSDGDDCYQYDCNRRIGLFCNEGSTPFVGSSPGECKPKQPIGGPCGSSMNCQSGLACDTGSKKCVAAGSPVATTTSWWRYCSDRYTSRFEACVDAEGSTCTTDSECGFSPLVCNTAYTNASGAFRSGRSGQCRLASSTGGSCEENADCVTGLTCNVATKICEGTTSGAGTTTPTDPTADPTATGIDEEGRPNFGLQWFRNPNTGVRTDSPNEFLTGVARTVTGMLALILVILILTGGVFMMTAAGNEKRYSFGKDIITYAIIGIIVVASAYIIAELVIRAITA